jgi:hypothetical protein
MTTLTHQDTAEKGKAEAITAITFNLDESPLYIQTGEELDGFDPVFISS